MSYQLLVEFRGGNSPSTEDAQKVLREFDQSLASSGGSVLQSIDSLSGDSFSIDLGRSNVIRFDVPYTSTFRSVTRAYNLAWAFADRFGGTV